MPGQNDKQRQEDRTPTRRVVLRRARVLELTDIRAGKTPEERSKRLERALNGRATEAWVLCGEFEGSKVGAIEAFAGKAGTPDAQVGVFRAPTVTAWKGGVEHVAPERPKVERSLFE